LWTPSEFESVPRAIRRSSGRVDIKANGADTAGMLDRREQVRVAENVLAAMLPGKVLQSHAGSIANEERN
jgi:hypothetical protein